jgi:hypothetical protein
MKEMDGRKISGLKKSTKGIKRGNHTPEEIVSRKAAFYKALQDNIGMVIRAERVTKIPSVTHYYWMSTDAAYKMKVDKLIELKRDHVEHHLANLVEQEDPSCVTFAARCLLRPRGYDQSTEIKNPDGDSFKMEISADILNQVIHTIYKDADKDSSDNDKPS